MQSNDTEDPACYMILSDTYSNSINYRTLQSYSYTIVECNYDRILHYAICAQFSYYLYVSTIQAAGVGVGTDILAGRVDLLATDRVKVEQNVPTDPYIFSFVKITAYLNSHSTIASSSSIHIFATQCRRQ